MDAASRDRSDPRNQAPSDSTGPDKSYNSNGVLDIPRRRSPGNSRPNTQQQVGRAAGSQAAALSDGNDSEGANASGDFWNPSLPGANAFGYSDPGRDSGGISRSDTVVVLGPVEPTTPAPRARNRPVLHQYLNGTVGNNAVNDGRSPSRNTGAVAQPRSSGDNPQRRGEAPMSAEINNTLSRERLRQYQQALHRYTSNSEDDSQQYVNHAGSRQRRSGPS
ncbi:Hypothetical predicted protein [Lecanosticta acicola]|uniref:Uncharacterized protein n=1 Tax=Lecanosticta acicola TaxID=111012 RepID=A0AAI9EE84_9PEZI|nr:Hypothetical predicted protein [Lecanosticta acicola]